MLGNIIGGFIVILVGTTLAPTVAQQVGTAQADGNVTGAADTILGLTTLFYCLSIATTSIGGVSAQAHNERNLIMPNPEYRLTSLRGQDRSVNLDSEKYIDSKYTRTTDKGFQNGRIYSLFSDYKMKSEINKKDCSTRTSKCRSNVRLLESSDKTLKGKLLEYPTEQSVG